MRRLPVVAAEGARKMKARQARLPSQAVQIQRFAVQRIHELSRTLQALDQAVSVPAAVAGGVQLREQLGPTVAGRGSGGAGAHRAVLSVPGGGGGNSQHRVLAGYGALVRTIGDANAGGSRTVTVGRKRVRVVRYLGSRRPKGFHSPGAPTGQTPRFRSRHDRCCSPEGPRKDRSPTDTVLRTDTWGQRPPSGAVSVSWR